MLGRGHAVLAHGHAACFGDFGAHFGLWQNPAVAWLGTLRQFELDHLDLGRASLRGKALGVKLAFRCAATKVAGADLPDQITAMFAVVFGDAAFARIVRKAALRRAFVQGFDGVGRQGPKAHARDVEQRQVVRLLALVSADRGSETAGVELRRLHGMGDPFGLRAIHVHDAAKATLVVLHFGAGIHQGPLVARKGQFFLVVFQKVLAQLGPDVFQAITDAARERVVAANGLFGLREIHPAQHKQQAKKSAGPNRKGPHDERGGYRGQPRQIA